MLVLTVNLGSSSVKVSLVESAGELRTVRREQVTAVRGVVDPAALKLVLEHMAAGGTLAGVAHRMVHGGTQFTDPVVLSDRVVERIQGLTDLAPLHLPAALRLVHQVGQLLPDVVQLACFDTAFHATLPAAARTYALPAEWRRRWDLRRFGFHGLSHAHAARRAAEMTGGGAGQRVVSCHLGAGASLAAVCDGASVDTTMGFTPLEGLVMATRSGSVDPGLLMWLIEHQGITGAELSAALEHDSGMLALSGTSDIREVLAAQDRGEPGAVLAVAVYLHRLRGSIAAMTAAMGGLDTLVFTGGVGEGAPAIRQGTADGLGFLGVAVEAGRNRQAVPSGDLAPDAVVSTPEARVPVIVVEAREDLEMVRQIAGLLWGAGSRQSLPGDPPTGPGSASQPSSATERP